MLTTRESQQQQSKITTQQFTTALTTQYFPLLETLSFSFSSDVRMYGHLYGCTAKLDMAYDIWRTNQWRTATARRSYSTVE